MYTGDKKKEIYRVCGCVYVCVSVCVCMDKHVYTACVCPTSSGGEKRKKKRKEILRRKTSAEIKKRWR